MDCAMSIPNYHGLMQPILRRLADQGGELAINVLSDLVAAAVELDERERGERLPSGQGTIFESRMRWALSYLEATQAVTTSPPDMVRLSEVGIDRMSDDTPNDPAGTTALHDEGERQKGDALPPAGEDTEEHLQRYFQTYYDHLKSELIKRVHAQPPTFFEDMVIDLLLAMGYGGRRPDLAKSLGRSGDGGIDGVVRQDSLGLDVVYVQAKRYRPGVAVAIAAVRDFAGALDAFKADKGVMVTTSHFPASAVEFAQASSRRIALIDGARLSSLLIRHNVGVRPHVTYELKRIDEGCFASPRENVVAKGA